MMRRPCAALRRPENPALPPPLFQPSSAPLPPFLRPFSVMHIIMTYANEWRHYAPSFVWIVIIYEVVDTHNLKLHHLTPPHPPPQKSGSNGTYITTAMSIVYYIIYYIVYAIGYYIPPPPPFILKRNKKQQSS
jgi:hypothetical protein